MGYNTGSEEFDFTGSFHTYFAADIDAVKVTGLEGLTVLDRLKEETSTVEGPVTISGEVDSLYYDSGDVVLETGSKSVGVGASGGWTDAVVWSPWTTMEACYKDFVCVENAAVKESVVLAPGEMWSATTTLTA